MAEDNGQTETSTETETTFVPIVGEDGVFAENWTHRLKDESLHEDPTLKTLKSIDMLAGNHVLQRKKIGGNTVLIPGEGSSEEEWNEFHTAAGRPDTAADYNLTRPEELPQEHYSQDLANAAQELFHKIGISKKQAEIIFKFHNDNAIATLTANQRAEEAEFKQLEQNLFAKWGNGYEQRKHFGNYAVEEGTKGDGEFKARLTAKFGNDADFIEFASNLGGKFAEHGDIATAQIPIPKDMQSAIDEEMGKKSYGLDYAKHGFTKAQHKAQVDKVYAMREELIKATKTG